MSIEEIRERDSAAADTWFKGPARDSRRKEGGK